MNQKQQSQQPKSLFSIPLNGCLSVIILVALATIAVKGCKMTNMKYEEQKVKHEMFIDSINKVRSDTLKFKSR